MEVLLVEPGKEARIAEIGNDLKSLQAAVGGYIEAAYPWDDPVAIVCNDDGKFNGLAPNRAIYDTDGEIVDIIAGTFLIVGLTDDNFGDLPDELARKYANLFAVPECFLRSGDHILVFPMASDPDACPF